MISHDVERVLRRDPLGNGRGLALGGDAIQVTEINEIDLGKKIKLTIVPSET